MFKYPPPAGYRIPGQPFARFGYGGGLWLPATIGHRPGLLPSGSGSAPIINLANFFSSPYNSVQTNLGLTYGGTLLPAAGNTATSVVSLSGSLPTVATPIRVKSVNSATVGSGASFQLSYDAGATFPTTVAPSVGVPIPLGGPASGLSITFAAGSGVANNTWDATCAALADQTGNGFGFSQATAGFQPVIGVGVNGVPSLLFGSVAATTFTSTLNMPAPGTTPWALAAVFKTTTYVVSGRYIGAASAANIGMIWSSPSTPTLQIFNGSGADSSNQLPVGTWGAVDCGFTNSNADYCRPGTGAGTTGANAGNSAGTGRRIGFDGTNPTGIFELISLAHVPIQSMAAWRAGVTAMLGGSVNV